MIDYVISQYPEDCRPNSIQCLGNAGGFSGAVLWRLTSRRGELCVRQWPTGNPDASRLNYIHAVLFHVQSRDVRFVPVPLFTKSGRSYVPHPSQDVLYEVTPWMPGESKLSRVDRSSTQEVVAENLAMAMRALAEFHLASQDFMGQELLQEHAGQEFSERQSDVLSPSRGLQRRLAFAERLIDGEWSQLESQLRTTSCPFDEKFREILSLAQPFVACLPERLRPAAAMRFRLQPCIRDIWSDHVLFEDSVSGIIDFGAMQQETVAGDIARLLGSVTAPVDTLWEVGLKAYASVRPLSADERTALVRFHESSVALSGVNWMRWVLIERRSFENTKGVSRRLDHILANLRLNLT